MFGFCLYIKGRLLKNFNPFLTSWITKTWARDSNLFTLTNATLWSKVKLFHVLSNFYYLWDIVCFIEQGILYQILVLSVQVWRTRLFDCSAHVVSVLWYIHAKNTEIDVAMILTFYINFKSIIIISHTKNYTLTFRLLIKIIHWPKKSKFRTEV